MIYEAARAVLRPMLGTLYRCKVTGQEHVPEHGPLIVASNHCSYLDPPLLGCAVPRPLHFMAKAELFKVPVLGWILPHIYAFPVQRGAGDRHAIRLALDLLQKGGALGVFPEGKRSRDGGFLPAQRGVGLLALKAGVPVVPAALIGTDRVWPEGSRRPRLTALEVRIGQPISPEALQEASGEDGRSASAAAGDRIMRAIVALHPGDGHKV